MNLYLPERGRAYELELCMLNECERPEHRQYIFQLATKLALPERYQRSRLDRRNRTKKRGRKAKLNHGRIKNILFQCGHAYKVSGLSSSDYLKLEATFCRRIGDRAVLVIVLVEHFRGRNSFYAYGADLRMLVEQAETK